MFESNIFITGGEVSGISMIGYQEYSNSLKQKVVAKINGTGGIYVYGLYRMGKTSLLNKIASEIEKSILSDVIVIQEDLANFDNNNENDYELFLKRIIQKLEKKLKKYDADLLDFNEAVEYFKDDMCGSNFLDTFECLKPLGFKVLLLVDEFDSAKNVFRSKGHFEIFRQLTSVGKFSTCLVTASKQELSMIEHENPNNSSFKGVMYPFSIEGFNDADINEYCRIVKELYEYELTEDDLEKIRYVSGSSPYLWSCIGHEIAALKIQGKDVCIEQILRSPSIISIKNGFHDAILKCLENDKDRDGVTSAEKLASVIIGPSFLATEDDIDLFISLNYLIDTGKEYVVFSPAFKNYLMRRSYNNDILNNFSTLEDKLKILLEEKKIQIFNAVPTSENNEDQNWINVLTKVWNNLEGKTFNSQIYQKQIKSTYREFNKTETILNVMSLEDCTRIIRNYWNLLSDKFNNDTKNKWENKFIECGKARNPVHHGSSKRLYSKEEKDCIMAYCLQIIKQLS